MIQSIVNFILHTLQKCTTKCDLIHPCDDTVNLKITSTPVWTTEDTKNTILVQFYYIKLCYRSH